MKIKHFEYYREAKYVVYKYENGVCHLKTNDEEDVLIANYHSLEALKQDIELLIDNYEEKHCK